MVKRCAGIEVVQIEEKFSVRQNDGRRNYTYLDLPDTKQYVKPNWRDREHKWFEHCLGTKKQAFKALDWANNKAEKSMEDYYGVPVKQE